MIGNWTFDKPKKVIIQTNTSRTIRYKSIKSLSFSEGTAFMKTALGEVYIATGVVYLDTES